MLDHDQAIAAEAEVVVMTMMIQGAHKAMHRLQDLFYSVLFWACLGHCWLHNILLTPDPKLSGQARDAHSAHSGPNRHTPPRIIVQFQLSVTANCILCR